MALWQPHLPGMGKPRFAKPHSVRQRQAMARLLCDLCGEPTKPGDRVSLSQERAVRVTQAGFDKMAATVVEPLMHHRCAARSAGLCPNLRAQLEAGTLWVREVTSCQLVLQQLTGAATMEFAGLHRPGTIGHMKLILTNAITRDMEWLQERVAA